MKNRTIFLRLLITLSFVTCGQIEMANASERGYNDFVDSIKVKKDSSFLLNPRQFTPLSFISALTMPNQVNLHFVNVTTMADAFPDDWIKSSDLDSLISLIGSTTKCNCFLNPLSSYIPTNEHADIGGYAIIFLNSFREKKKISLGLYNCPRTNKESVDEIMKWWTDYKLAK